MKVTHELKDELNGVINIVVETEDYKPKVETTLKTQRKRAQMPGFRPGKVPMGMVKKMYGPTVIAQEVNDILAKQLDEYIKEKDLKILGSPLPKEDNNLPEFDPNTYPEMEFNYEIGLAPDFKLKISEKDKFTKYKVKVDDALLNKYTDDLARRYGSMKEADKAGENDMLNGQFVELDEKGQPKENGIKHNSSISLEFLEDEKIKKELTGKKPGDVFEVDPDLVSKGAPDKAAMLNISTEEAEALKTKFQYTVEKVFSLTPANVDQAFYDKIFGEGTVKSDEEFKEKLSENLTSMFERDADNVLQKHIREDVLKRHKMELPDEFLKRWVVKSEEKKGVTPEDVEKDYDKISEQILWDLITNRLIDEHKIEVKHEEVVEQIKNMVKQQLAQYGMADADDEMVNQMASRYMESQEELRKVYDNLYGEKLFDVFKNTFKIKEKEVDFDEFVKLATGKAPKKGILNNLQNAFK